MVLDGMGALILSCSNALTLMKRRDVGLFICQLFTSERGKSFV